MRRIPSFDGRPVADHLVATTRVGFTQYGKPTFLIPSIFPQTPAMPARCCANPSGFRSGHRALAGRTGAFSARASGKSSPRARSVGSANTSGSAGGNSSTPKGDRRHTRNSSATGFTRSLVAAKARKASARTVGDMFMQMMLTFLDPTGGSTDRLLDGPTNLVWIDPWLQLSGMRAACNTCASAEVEQILCDRQRVTGVAVPAAGTGGLC